MNSEYHEGKSWTMEGPRIDDPDARGTVAC
jgi:hypothetical protein